MEVFTIGFAKKTAPEFFETLRRANIKRLIDIRLKNTSQLARFTRREDLPYFLRELCGADYVHEPMLSPSQDILDAYKKQKGSWEEFERRFLALMAERRIEDAVDRGSFETPTVLLCSEPTADDCHRRLVLEYLREKWGNLEITHL